MDLYAAQDTIRTSLERLSKHLNTPLRQMGGKYISSDIIMNGALAVIRKRDWEISIENERDDNSPHESFLSNLRRVTGFASQVDQNPEYRNIDTYFKEATLLTINGTSLDDVNYIQEEIFKVLKNEYGPSEEVVKNYFRQYHGLTLYQDKNDDEEDY